MSDNHKDQEKIIYKVYLEEIDGKKQMMFERNSNHIPTLACISKQLDYEIIELQAIEKAKQEKAKLKILTSNPIIGISEFLRRKRK